MEVPLQQITATVTTAATGNSFNPCFNGSSSATKITQNDKNISNYVSILVLMEVPLQLIQLYQR